MYICATAFVSFVVFAVAATSMVATYLLLLYGTVASTAYMMVCTPPPREARRLRILNVGL